MISLREATSAFQQPGQSLSVQKVVAGLPFQPAPPISITRLTRLLNRGGVLARLGGRYADVVNELDWSSDELVGFVDLHTHPAAHLAYGSQVFYGAPDGDPSFTFNDCGTYHAGWSLVNLDGNLTRAQVVSKIMSTDYDGQWTDGTRGWPDFFSWPTWHDRLHQQVRVEVLQRAWQGGLRVVVAHAVNSHTLAFLAQTNGPYDDKTSGDLQIAAIKEMVAGQHFMELALSPADIRAIVGRGHLAVIIGVELDCLGNFYSPVKPDGSYFPFEPQPSDDAIRAEVGRLHDAGVRYVFPVHLTDNVFGGAALYEMEFDAANRFQFGAFYTAEVAPPESQLGWELDPSGETFWQFLWTLEDSQNILVIESLGFDPGLRPTPPPTFTGHRNSRGLQDRGRVLLDALMTLGMLIDVDHMGEKTMRDTLAHTSGERYPVFAGHCGVRASGGNERSHLIQDATEILQRGGLWGVGIKGGLASVHANIVQLRCATPSGGLAVGSDCSGMEQLPGPRAVNASGADPIVTAQEAAGAGTVVYRDLGGAPPDALERCIFGNRTESIFWDGFSHVGMYPDFLEDGISSSLLTQDDVTELFRAPEALAQAWESCLLTAGQLAAERRGPSVAVAANANQFVFWRGTDNNLWEAFWDGSKWNGPLPRGMGPLGSEPTSGVDGNGGVYVYWRGSDNNLWKATWGGSKWNGPLALGIGPLGSEPSTAVASDSTVLVFWRGTDHNLWQAGTDNTGRDHPAQGDGMGPLGSGPTAGVDGNGSPYVFWKGTDNNLWEAFFDGTKWNGPQSLGMGPLGSAPSVAVASNANQFVFWRGTDNNLWEAFWDGSKWNGPLPLGMGPLGSEPTAGVDANGGVYVYWKGSDNNLREAFWDGSKWTGPLLLGMGPLA